MNLKPASLIWLSLLAAVVGCRSARPVTVPDHFGSHDADHTAVAVLHEHVAQSGFPAVESVWPVAASGVYSIEQLVEYAVAGNPNVAAARYAAEAARQRVPQEAALPDPVLNTTTYLAPVQTAAGEQDFGLGISQKYVDARRRSTRAGMACEEFKAARAELAVAELDVAEKVRTTCYRILEVRQLSEITQLDLVQLEQIRDIVLRRYEVGADVSQKDVLAIQLEQSELTGRLLELKEREAQLRSSLARLLNVSSADTIQLEDGMLEPADGDLDLDAMVSTALQMRPELQNRLARLRRDQKAVSLAMLGSRPDVTVGLNWIATSTNGISPVANGDDALMLGIGFNLPVRNGRIQGAVSEASAHSLASQSRLEGTRNQIADEIANAIASAENAGDMLELLDQEMMPAAQRVLDLSIDEYAEGDGDYVQLIENWRALLRFRKTRIKLLSAFNIAMANLTRATGSLMPIEARATRNEFNQPPFELQGQALDGAAMNDLSQLNGTGFDVPEQTVEQVPDATGDANGSIETNSVPAVEETGPATTGPAPEESTLQTAEGATIGEVPEWTTPDGP